MVLYWRNSTGWGLSPITDSALRIQQAEETMAVEALASFTIAGFTDADVNLYIESFNINKETAERIIQVQSTNPCDRSTEDWLFLRSVLYSALAQHDQESGFVEGQLIRQGAPYTNGTEINLIK